MVAFPRQGVLSCVRVRRVNWAFPCMHAHIHSVTDYRRKSGNFLLVLLLCLPAVMDWNLELSATTNPCSLNDFCQGLKRNKDKHARNSDMQEHGWIWGSRVKWDSHREPSSRSPVWFTYMKYLTQTISWKTMSCCSKAMNFPFHKMAKSQRQGTYCTYT